MQMTSSNTVPSSLLDKKPEVNAIGATTLQLTDLFMAGLYWLHKLAEKQPSIRFSQWAKIIRSARSSAGGLTEEDIMWLWEAVTTQPEIRDSYGSRLISLDEEWRKLETVECVPAGQRFGVFLKSFSSFGSPMLPLPKDIKPDAEAEILGPLRMKPGKARRLECCDVQTLLEVRPNHLGPKNVEAAAFKVEVGEVRIEKGCIYVNVKSLNHAYTKASLRLEEHRRGPGGRAYDHIALKEESGEWKSLEKIRVEAEKSLRTKLFEGNEQVYQGILFQP
jgi:hypothetical protein